MLSASVVATRPPTSMLAVRPNSTPPGLTRKIWPLALSRPKISEGLLPTTRLNRIEPAPGCVTATDSLPAMEKPCQLMIEFCVAWLIVRLVGLGVAIAELPETTWPPVGSACAACGKANAAPTASAVARRRSLLDWAADLTGTDDGLRLLISHSPERAYTRARNAFPASRANCASV